MKKILCLFLALLSFAQLTCDEINWGSPTTLSTPTVDASDAHIKIDHNGNVVSLWIENGNLISSSLPFGGSWSIPVTLSSSGNVTNPKMAVDSSGNVSAIWAESGAIKVTTLPFGGSWGSTTTLASSGASQPDLATDSSGNLVAVWARSGNIESKTKPFGGSWSLIADVLLSTSADSPHVAIGNGRVVAIWHGLSGITNTIYSATKLIAGVWGTPVAISSAAHDSKNARISIDSNGNALAMWFIYTLTGSAYSDVYVESSYLPSGISTWGLPVVVSEAGIYNPSKLYLRFGFDASGNAMAIWNTSFDGVTFYVQSAFLPNGGNWSSPFNIDIDVYSFFVDIAVSDSVAFASYSISDTNQIDIQAISSNTSAFFTNLWSQFATLSQNGFTSSFPRIAGSMNGNTMYAAAIWLAAGTNVNVQSATGTGTLLQPPSNLAITQNFNDFGSFNEYYNTLTWDLSPSPNIIEYYIFRNGVLITQLGANTTSYVDHNRILGQTDVYGVAAVDNQTFQSTPATISYP